MNELQTSGSNDLWFGIPFYDDEDWWDEEYDDSYTNKSRRSVSFRIVRD